MVDGFPEDSTHLQVPLFKGLTPKQFEQLRPVLHFKTFPASTRIFNSGQPGEAVYIVVSGTVKIHSEQPDGRDVFIDLSGAGDIVGEMSIIEGVGRSATATTLEESTLMWIERVAFLQALDSLPLLMHNLILILSNRLRRANERIESFASHDVDGRVARHILAFARKYGHEDAEGNIVIPIRLTQSELAELAGASRVRVNQIINSYKQHRYISVDQAYHITVHDPNALAKRFQ